MSRELLNVIDQTKAECDVMKERKKVRDQEYKTLKAKCEAAMADFDKNLAVNVLREKISSLSGEASHSTLESKVASLETEKVTLKATEASLRQELENARLVAKLVSSAIFYWRCHAFEEVANMKEPFYIMKVKGYRSAYKHEHTKVGNEFANVTFPYLADVVVDPHAYVKVLLLKNPRFLQRRIPTRTHVHASFAPSQKATPSPALMSPPLQITPAATLVSKT
nr:hypothetical protein [Tanacetum cinerariifolium]